MTLNISYRSRTLVEDMKSPIPNIIKDDGYYGMLEIPLTASLSDIQRAYRLKALRLHPDKNINDPNAGEKFHRLQEAYLVLSDSKLRSLYDDKIRLEYERYTRDIQMDEKRRALKNDLLSRENEAKKQQNREYQAECAKQAFETALSELLKEQKRKTAKTFSVPSNIDSFDIHENVSEHPDFERVIKVIFPSTRSNNGSQIESMERLWNRYGPIQKISLFGSFESGYCGALICFVSQSSVQNSIRDIKASWRQIYNISTFISQNSLISFIKENPTAATHKVDQDIKTKKFHSYDRQAYSKLPFDSYEKQTLDRMLTQK